MSSMILHNNFSDYQPPSPTARLQPYEVFISFRGEDTRKNFVSHLNLALKDRGIQTYFDEDNLQKGQTIGPELVKAIEESSIAIVVLSSNYGSSTWCLDELVKIMECKNKFGLFVFPIFYHVVPSDVRNQKNSFSEAFSRHEVNFEPEKIESWKKALTQIANLAGDEINGQNEALSIRAIRDKILKKIPPEASDFRKSLVGIESRISRIKNLMESKPGEVLFIGLYGMGGIGKTTTASAVFEDCKQKFDGSCFLHDVKKSESITTLQYDLLSQVLNEKCKDNINDVWTGSSFIKMRLQFKKVLIVIDDVDNEDQLNALANGCDWFGEGSIIIITTRDKQLVNRDHIQKYAIDTLCEDEAFRLFCLHAFKNDHRDEDFIKLSHDVVSYAGGLPLALRVLGSHLFRQNIGFWTSALKSLKDVPHGEIVLKLKISFDGLKNAHHEKIFLDIACFFMRNSAWRLTEQLKALWVDLQDEGIGVLVRKSLIHITDADTIEMHDLIQDMGRYIIQQRSNGDIRKNSHLSRLEDISNLLTNSNGPSEVERIHVDTHNWHSKRGLQNQRDSDMININLLWEAIFENMDKLSFFEMWGNMFKGNYNVNVSQPLGKRCHNLRWFNWSYYPAQSLPENFQPINLIRLELQCSEIKETPNFSHMPNLEVLDLSWSYKLVHVHPSLGNHKKIKHINLEYCKELEVFPTIVTMKSLEFLELSYTKLSVPEIDGKLDSLRILRLSSDSLTMSRFVSIEAVSVSCHALVTLYIEGTDMVKTPDFSCMPNLEWVDLSNSKELVQVDASLGVHKRIEYIRLRECSKLEEFPTIVDMISLRSLDFKYTRLRSLPEMKGNVKCLNVLMLDEAEIKSLPRSIEHAINLETLIMHDCDYLVTLPIIFLHPKIGKIKISSKSLKNFKDENMEDESASQQSKQFIGSQGKEQRSLTNLDLSNCVSLEEIPGFVLSRIKHLEITNCPILTGWICDNLVHLLDKYQQLYKLILHQDYHEEVSHKILQAFSERELVSDMMGRRGTPFEVCIPGTQIPSWFQYQYSSPSVTVFLPRSLKWVTDNLRGFVITGINATENANNFTDYYCCPGSSHVVVMYMPIDKIKRDIKYWDKQKPRTLIHITSRIKNEFEGDVYKSSSLRWGLSLVYNDGKVNEVDPLKIISDDNPKSRPATFQVMFEGSGDKMEKLNNPLQLIMDNFDMDDEMDCCDDDIHGAHVDLPKGLVECYLYLDCPRRYV